MWWTRECAVEVHSTYEDQQHKMIDPQSDGLYVECGVLYYPKRNEASGVQYDEMNRGVYYPVNKLELNHANTDI